MISIRILSNGYTKNNIFSIILQLGFGESDVYVVLPLSEKVERLSSRPSVKVKYIKIQVCKPNTVVMKSR